MKYKLLILALVLLLNNNQGIAQDAFTVSTFHNISLYWSPDNGSIEHEVLVQFKPEGSNNWQEGLSMKYNPIVGSGVNPATGLRYDKADYRGSLVNLTPNTNYDIQVTLEGIGTISNIQASTWNEDYPIAQTIGVDDMNNRLSYGNLAGSAGGYILIDGTGSTIDVDKNAEQCIRLINCEYVILKGFTLRNASGSGIRLYDCHHIVVEDCDISAWGSEDFAGTGFGMGNQSGIYAGTNDAHHCVFQRNKIHNPSWDTNSWAELHDPNADPEIPNNYHPKGPQGIGLGNCYIGNNVIRYNEMWSDSDHYFNDVVGMWPNGSYAGFPGSDSDIYGNYFANCFDDGIESEGGNTNVRIWNNYIEEVFIGIGNAATSIGPLYVFRNVSGRAYSHPASVHGDYGGFIKMGFANSINWMTGQMYIFNNTILQPNDHGCGGLGTSYGSNRPIKHCTTLNNIIQVRTTTDNSISTEEDNVDNSYDFDLANHPFPNGHEANGISGTPTYSVGAPSFDFNSKTGNFKLSSASDGFDDGTIIPNFCTSYNGDAPDMGAHEGGSDNFEYGVNAVFIPPSSIGFVDLNLKAFLQGPYTAPLMTDGLRSGNHLPLQEPYSALEYNPSEITATTNGVLSDNGSNSIVDWVLVQARNNANPSEVIRSKAALIQRDGDIVNPDGTPLTMAIPSQYGSVYIAVIHRNHFGVRTLNAIPTNATINVDFTDPATVVFGNNPMVQIGNKMVFFAGDANDDGTINSVDLNDYWRVFNSLPFDYNDSKADFNLDGTINAFDRNDYWRPNSAKTEQLD